jgi:hypothetical protein
LLQVAVVRHCLAVAVAVLVVTKQQVVLQYPLGVQLL